MGGGYRRPGTFAEPEELLVLENLADSLFKDLHVIARGKYFKTERT